MTQPPQSLLINTVKRTRRAIDIQYHSGAEGRGVNSPDNPLPAFTAALDALPALVCQILALPTSYTENLKITGLVMGLQGEADTVSILAQKSLNDASKAFNIVTPPRLLAHPTEPGSYTPPLSNADAALVWTVIEESKAYVSGDRAQGQLPLDKDKDAEDEADLPETAPEEGTNLPFEQPAEMAATAGKKRARKKKE